MKNETKISKRTHRPPVINHAQKSKQALHCTVTQTFHSGEGVSGLIRTDGSVICSVWAPLSHCCSKTQDHFLTARGRRARKNCGHTRLTCRYWTERLARSVTLFNGVNFSEHSWHWNLLAQCSKIKFCSLKHHNCYK